jgi:hypothetical protein
MAESIVPSGYFGNKSNNIHIIENFADPLLCDQVYEYCMDNKVWLQSTPNKPKYWEGRIIRKHVFENESFSKDLDELNDRITELLEKNFLVTLDKVNMHKKIIITKWPSGYEQDPHADRESLDGKLQPNLVALHHLSSVMYFNENITGGELYFRDHNMVIPPKKGLLVLFPGDRHYIHGVKKIIDGTRFTMHRFWAVDQIL